MRRGIGIGAPNGSDQHGMADSWATMLDVGFGAYRVLHHQRQYVKRIKARYPDAYVEVRHYEQYSMERLPEAVAVEAFGRTDWGEPEGYMVPLRSLADGWVPANELNIPHEGGGKTAAHYSRQRDWTKRVAEEVRRRAPWATLHFPAQSPGNSEDQDDVPGVIGYEILRPAIDLYDVLDVHNYWFADRATLDGDKAEWYAQRFRRAHAFFPDKTLAIGEFNREWNRNDPADQQRIADEYVAYYRIVEATPYLLWACAFLFDSPDPGHRWSSWMGQPKLLNAVTALCNEKEAPVSPLPEPISDPYAAWRLTQEYGLTEYAKAHPEIYKGCGGIHPGRDYAMASGTPVAAPWDGVIVNDRVSAAYGVCCRIRDTHDYLHLLGHLKSVVLSVGSSVVRGELVALSDNTGTSNGAHLHWEVRENGKWFNPLVWVERMNQEANKVTDAEFESWWRMLKPDAEYNPTFGIETAVRQAMERGEVKAPPLSNEYNYPGNRDWNVRHFGNGQTAVYSKSKNVVSWM